MANTKSKAEKPYTFRTLKADDLFLMINLVKKIGIDKIGKSITDMKGENKDVLAVNVGMAFFQLLLDSISNAKKEIYELLSSVSNLSYEEVENLDIDVFTDMVNDFVEMKSVKNLFQRVVSLLKKAK